MAKSLSGEVEWCPRCRSTAFSLRNDWFGWTVGMLYGPALAGWIFGRAQHGAVLWMWMPAVVSWLVLGAVTVVSLVKEGYLRHCTACRYRWILSKRRWGRHKKSTLSADTRLLLHVTTLPYSIPFLLLMAQVLDFNAVSRETLLAMSGLLGVAVVLHLGTLAFIKIRRGRITAPV
jgi:hypothetical protein